VTASQISDVISRSGGENLQDLLVFDVYRGKGVDSGRKSVALGLILQDYSRTLTDKDVEEIIEPVLQGLQKELNATLRE
jgi:phenylalanyl-tRNA synthetase beta chain